MDAIQYDSVGQLKFVEDYLWGKITSAKTYFLYRSKILILMRKITF